MQITVAVLCSRFSFRGIFQTARSRSGTGYRDWHLLASHAMQRSTTLGVPVRPADLMRFFASRPDWSFYVHGAAWSAVSLLGHSGRLHFSENPRASHAHAGAVQLVFAPRGLEELRRVCPPPAENIAGADRMWVSNCWHGIGHGAFHFALESLVQAKKNVTVHEVSSAEKFNAVQNTNSSDIASLVS